MAFEIYKPRGEKVGKFSLVTLSNNSITLNKIAREKLSNPNTLEFAYDKDSNLMRIKPTDAGQVMKKTKVFAKGFFNHFNIDKKGKFIANYDENENALYVNLNEEFKPA